MNWAVRAFKVKSCLGLPVYIWEAEVGSQCRTVGWNGGSDIHNLSFHIPPVGVGDETKNVNVSYSLMGSSLVDGGV